MRYKKSVSEKFMFIVDSKYDTLEIVREAFVKSCLVG